VTGAHIGTIDQVFWITIRGLVTFSVKQSIRNFSHGQKLILFPESLGICVHSGPLSGICMVQFGIGVFCPFVCV
jgi:hypothetical protein